MIDGRPSSAHLSFPSVKDDEATRHTAEIIAFCGSEAFATWSGTDWMRRGEDYTALKTRITQGLLDLAETVHPSLRGLIEYTELSTPLTVETFTGHRAGAIYGLAGTPDRFRARLVPVRSPVPGLLLTGADVCTSGIMGALMGGAFAVAETLGPAGLPTVLRAARASRVATG